MLDIWESIGMLEGLKSGRFAMIIFRQLGVTLFSGGRVAGHSCSLRRGDEHWIMELNRVVG